MPNPLDVIPAAITAAAGALFSDATITRDVAATSSDDFTPETTESEFSCKALVTKYSDRLKAAQLVDDKDRKILVLQTTLSTTPEDRDRITVGGVAFTVLEVDVDPARAVWVLRCKMA